MLKKYDNIWISSHGLGIDYLHIRICNYPKYYEKSITINRAEELAEALLDKLTELFNN